MSVPRRRSHRPSKRVIREFNDRGALWLLEDPINFHDLLQVVAPDLAVQLDFSRAVRVNRSSRLRER